MYDEYKSYRSLVGMLIVCIGSLIFSYIIKEEPVNTVLQAICILSGISLPVIAIDIYLTNHCNEGDEENE